MRDGFSSLRRLGAELQSCLLAALPANGASGHTLIFGQGRSGSTLLESLLSSTGLFVSRGELLGQEHSRLYLPQAYLRGQARLARGRNLLCHVKIYHLTRDRERAGRRPVDPGEFLRGLAANGWRIIYLRRTNRVRHALSNILAEARSDYHKFDDNPETARVRVSRERLETLVRERIAFERQERAALAGIPFHEVVYERDLEDAAGHQHTVDAILEFLGLPPRPASTAMRKVAARPLRDLVANHDEFMRWAEELGFPAAAA